MKPANAIAETVLELKNRVEVSKASIDIQNESIAKNEATIAELEPLAEWAEEPVDPTV